MKTFRVLLLLAAGFLVALAALKASAYRPPSQPAESPRVVAAAAPAYPPIAAAARAASDVTVEVRIDADGKVASAEALAGHPLLQQAAKNAARRWKFETASRPSVRTAKLTFGFRIAEKNVPAAEATPVFLPPYRVEIIYNPPAASNSPVAWRRPARRRLSGALREPRLSWKGSTGTTTAGVITGAGAAKRPVK